MKQIAISPMRQIAYFLFVVAFATPVIDWLGYDTWALNSEHNWWMTLLLSANIFTAVFIYGVARIEGLLLTIIGQLESRGT